MISQASLLQCLIELAVLVPNDVTKVEFPARRITFPIVLDDSWNKEALARYMATTRDKAVYLPSNVDYLASNNGLSGAKDALDKLIGSDWVRFVYSLLLRLTIEYEILVGFWCGLLSCLPISGSCEFSGYV